MNPLLPISLVIFALTSFLAGSPGESAFSVNPTVTPQGPTIPIGGEITVTNPSDALGGLVQFRVGGTIFHQEVLAPGHKVKYRVPVNSSLIGSEMFVRLLPFSMPNTDDDGGVTLKIYLIVP